MNTRNVLTIVILLNVIQGKAALQFGYVLTQAFNGSPKLPESPSKNARNCHDAVLYKLVKRHTQIPTGIVV